MEYRWELAQKPDNTPLELLRSSLGVSEFIARLLIQRGVTTFDQAKEFFRPSLGDLHDPFLMKDMDKAVGRIQTALEEGQKILIYGDYDVDGTTSVALMVTFFNHFYTENIDYYIPDRYTEGYGVSFQGVDYAKENDCALIIALDCGIRAHEKVDYATKKGIDFIICDHHLPHGSIPKAVAVLNHKRPDCEYPYKELSGCGIGFKLCQALAQELNLEDHTWQDLLDLVAISSACDIVPLTGENRVLVHLGMEQLNANPRGGIESMIELSGKKGMFSVTDVVFVIGPRINAAGRIEHAKKAVELLLSESGELAEKASKILEERNLERRELDKHITEEALSAITESNFEDKKSTVVYDKNWHKGVVGIVASRLTEHYYRPTIVLTESNGKAVGSARSVKGYDIHEALTQCSDVLEQFGGHHFAAGMTLEIDNVPKLQTKFEEVVSSTIDPELLVPKLEIDLEIELSAIDEKFWRIIKQFAPFGPDNMKPVFVTRNCVDGGWSKAVGGDKTHLKLDVVQQDNPGVKISGIAFKMGHLEKEIKSKKPFDVVYTIEENEWQGNVTLQLMVKDLRFSSAKIRY
ncbi:single-stranded-DNA-specific exonuclease RecJ [Salibacteraceae bacterium]|nr:single-stranded-DNA-specific exonuclease RecJ [Salibacteraceae bacterium]